MDEQDRQDWRLSCSERHLREKMSLTGLTAVEKVFEYEYHAVEYEHD